MNVNVHETIIRKTLNDEVHGGDSRRKSLFSTKNNATLLQFVKNHMNKPGVYWTNVLWVDEIKMRSFWLEWKVLHLANANAAFQHKNLIPSIKQVLVWLCCLCTRMACCHWWNHEFWILPENSTGKHQGLWTEPQEKMGHATRNNWTNQIIEPKWLKQKKINILDCLN